MSWSRGQPPDQGWWFTLACGMPGRPHGGGSCPAILGGRGQPAVHQGRDPLYVACSRGCTEVVCALLSAGARVGVPTKAGVSLLHMACFKGHTEVVHALLSAGDKANLLTQGGCSPQAAACCRGHIGVIRALLSAGAVADLRDSNGRTPLDLLPRAQRAEVERLVQHIKEERDIVRADDESRVRAPSAPASVLPPPHLHPSSQLQAACEDDSDEGSSECPGGMSAAEACSSSSGRSASGHVCSMCGGPPSASSFGVAKLKACRRCMSVRYCSQECQKKHWEEGGHKAACPQLREMREGRKGVEAERQEPR